ncbi:MAG: pinensin family lanthipeptide, partial [Bacteroidota bacterium]
MKEKREKLSLNELNVKSFVTSFKGKKVETVKGGGSNPVDTDPIACPADSDFNVCDEPTAI